MRIDPVQIRRKLHQIPEIAFGEHKTKALILSELGQLSAIKIHEFRNSPAVLVEYTKGSGAYKLFRADMDALPVFEKTSCNFQSTHEGLMHACGHDVHMAILLGFISEVTKLAVEQNLLFLFQPAEEGKGGAQSVLEEGIIQSFEIEAAFALHVNPKLGLNQVSTKSGIFFAIPQEFDVTFYGKTAHVAFPEAGKDALKAGINFYQRMQESIAVMHSEERCIFHIGKLNSGLIRNIIADECKLEGTHRTLSKAMSSRLNELIKTNAKACAEELDLYFRVDFLCSYEPVVNDETIYKAFVQTCNTIGIEFIESATYMTGEDFGYFTSLYPGLLFWLGANDPEHDLHSEFFLPDEACIETGIKMFMALAVSK